MMLSAITGSNALRLDSVPLLMHGEEHGSTTVSTQIINDYQLSPPLALPDWCISGTGTNWGLIPLGRQNVAPTLMSTQSSTSTVPLTSRDYEITVERVRELLKEEDEDDRPSDYAYGGAVQLLRDVATKLGMSFPRATVATGPNRGVRLQWTSGNREVRVTIGGTATNKSYLYWRKSETSGIEPGLEAAKIPNYVEWITQV